MSERWRDTYDQWKLASPDDETPHKQHPEGDACPACGMDALEGDAVDIGVGTQYRPWHCLECGWAEPEPEALGHYEGPEDDDIGF